MTNDTVKTIATIIGCAFIILSALALIKAWVDTPTVIYSWSSKECKAIIYPDGHRADCSGLKDLGSYDAEWGE